MLFCKVNIFKEKDNKSENLIKERIDHSLQEKITYILSPPMDRLRLLYKRVSLCNLKSGSFTVEAAIIIPLLMVSIVTIVCCLKVFKLQLIGDMELADKAKKAALYAQGVEYESNPIIEFIEYKSYELPISILPMGKINYVCRGRARAWIGKTQDIEDEVEIKDRLVYVTEYESVYHTNSACSHLELSISSISYTKLPDARNKYGVKYKKCKSCVKEKSDSCYVTEMGDRYHNYLQCSGLTRTIRMRWLSSINTYNQCQRCNVKGKG